MTIAFVHLIVHLMVQSDDNVRQRITSSNAHAQVQATSLLRPGLLLLGREVLQHLLDHRRVLRTVLCPLLCCRCLRCLRRSLCWRGLWERLLRVDGLLGHLGILRVGVRLLVRLLEGLLVGLLVRLRVGLVCLLGLRLDVWLLLLHLGEVELVRLGLLRCLCLCHGLLESRGSLSLRCIRGELSSLWRLILLLLVVVGVTTTLALALSVTSATASFATSASTPTTSVVPTTTAAAIGIATLLWNRSAHLLHLSHVVWALERSVHAVVIRLGLYIIVVVQH
jgi:hypothetical protein